MFRENERMHQKFGTLIYAAPEVLKGCYTEKCDIWSCGVILYILLCGYPPFKAKNEEAMISLIEKGQFSFDSFEWKQVSVEAKSLISRMLTLTPHLRPTAEECLNDVWLKKALIPLDCSKEKLEKALTNLKNFRVLQKFFKRTLLFFKVRNGLQHAVLAFIVNILTTSEEKIKLIEIFNSLDQDGDGQLTKADLKIGY